MSTIEERLRKEAHSLLDLTTRTRLLHTPRKSGRSKLVNIVDELSVEVFRILVTEKKDMSFRAAEPAVTKATENALHSSMV